MLDLKLKKFRPQFGISILILIFTFILKILNINNFLTTLFSIISACFIPGFSLLKKLRLELECYETFFMSIVFSLAILLIFSLWLSISPFYITFISIFISIFSFVLLCTFNLHNVNLYTYTEVLYQIYTNIKKNKGIISIIIIIAFSPFILLQNNILKYKYFLGYDPYSIEPITSFLNEYKVKPIELLNKRSIVFSGHNFFILTMHLFTTISVYNIVRFGGLFYLSLVCIILFLTLYRIEKNKWVALIPFLYITNYFVCTRFVMTIRENLSYVFLTVLLFLIVLLLINKTSKNIYYAIGMIYALIISTHPLTLLFSIFILLFYIIIHKDKSLLFSILIGIILILPLMNLFIPWFIYTLIIQLQKLLGWGITFPSWRVASTSSKWGLDILLSHFSILEIILLPLSILYIQKKRDLTRFHLFYIIPISLLSIFLYLLTKLGLNFTPARLNIYISLLLSIISGLGLIELINIFISKLPGKIILILNGRRMLINKVNNIIAILIIVIPIVMYNSLTPINLNKWSPYEAEQVEAAQWIVENNLNISNVLIIAPQEDMGILEYVGLEPLYKQRNIINKILSANSIEEFINLISIEYSSINKLYLFMSGRWINSYKHNYQIINKLENNYDIIYDKSVIIIEIPIFEHK